MGPTHQGTEDVGTRRMMPNMTVITHGNPLQLVTFVQETHELPGPVHIRLGRGDDPVVHARDVELRIGTAIERVPGNDATIIVRGTITNEATAASRLLAQIAMTNSTQTASFEPPFSVTSRGTSSLCGTTSSTRT